ncbi:hypothetical protein VaNZ11_013084 [Volvox africanus]|uniref:SBP-type domain-containing protein n=1 Tax=Volvox africanus TaxID=51714 RepID=A0ABQ5SFD2_9CHLO|nr:hypothetical protein VaNZ11_013084 [Volvox africanus]
MDRNDDDAHADWSPQDIAWDGITLTARKSGTDANVPTIDRYYIKGRGAAISGTNGTASSSSCRVPGCISDLSRDLAYFRKYRICREHLKSPVLLVEGVPSRFCQQCSRFHHVKEFDGPQRTCRAMLERLRIKRNSTKSQTGGRNGCRVKNDTRPTDASREGGSSSQSNSTGKDAERPKNQAPSQQQHQPSPVGLAPTDSGEGVESVAAMDAAFPRRSASTATASSIPGLYNQDKTHIQNKILEQQALLQLTQGQLMLTQMQNGEERLGSLFNGASGRSLAEMQDNGGLEEQHDLLHLYPPQNPLPLHRALLGGASIAAAAATRDVRVADYDIADRRALAGGAMPPPYRNASPHGLSTSVGPGGGSGLQRGPRTSVAATATSLEDHLARQQTSAAPPLVQLCHRERESGRDESLLLQLSVPWGHQNGVTAARQGRVLDLGQPPAPAGPVLNLGSRVDLSLELQLQDIYREMAISEAATEVAAAANSTRPRQGVLNRALSSGVLQGRCTGAAVFPSDPLLPQGHHAAAPAPLISSDQSAVFGQLSAGATRSGAASTAALLAAPLPAQQYQLQQQLAAAAQHQHQRAFSDLASSSWLSMVDNLDMDSDPLPASLMGRSAATAAEAAPAVVRGSTVYHDARAGRAPLLGLAHQHLSQSQQSTQQQQQQQQQQQMSTALTGITDSASGGGIVKFEHVNSLVAGGSFGIQNALSDLRTAMLGASMPGGSAGISAADCYDDGAVVSLPEAGDGNTTSWCGADDIDAALDILMKEAGSGAVYKTSDDSTSLERVCFKLHNLHPRDLPSDLMCAMGSWLAAARAEVVQGALRPGCTELILDIYTTSPNPADKEMEKDEASGTAGSGGSAVSVGFPFPLPLPLSDGELSSLRPLPISPPEAAELYSKTSIPEGKIVKARVLGGLMPSKIDLACLDAAAATAGAEAFKPFMESGRAGGLAMHDGNSRFGGGGGSRGGGNACAESSSVTHLSAYVMHNGNVRAAAGCFKKLLGPRAVQSMSVTINHEVLSISSRDMGHYVADVRGTLAGLSTPLLLSVSPLAVLAGEPAVVKVIGSHLAGPGRRPQVRCQGTHVVCSVVTAPAGGSGGNTGFQRLRPDEDPALMDKIVEHTLPGSHRSKAMAYCSMVDLNMEIPDTAGLLMLEWEADRPSGGFAISEWLPLLSVPDAAMAEDINNLAAKKGGNDRRLRCFLQDLGLALDYVARIEQCVLLPMSALMSTEQEAAGGDGVGAAAEPADSGPVSVGGGGGSSNSVAGGSVTSCLSQAAIESGFESWQNRSCGGGDDQRELQAMPRVSNCEIDDKTKLEHDSLSELMGRPRLSKKHYNRVAALAPALLAFAADSGMPAVISWLMDFMLEHMYFGDLAAVFQCVEAVGGSKGLPLLHRAVRSGSTRTVRLLLHRATSHGLACNLAQPAGLYNITPLHLAALQPVQSGMLQACGCADPRVAQLWATVPDAAGRTPAMYLRRQLDLSALTGSNPAIATALLHAAASVVASAAGPVQPRSSISGSTTGTACCSWGSDETYVDSVVVMADTGISMGTTSVLLPAATGDECSSGDGGTAAAAAAAAQRVQAASGAASHGCDSGWISGRVGWRDSASGNGGDDGEGVCRGRRGHRITDTVGYPHSQAAFRVGGRGTGERTILVRQPGGLAVEVHAAPLAEAATASGAALCRHGSEICTETAEAGSLNARVELVVSIENRDSGDSIREWPGPKSELRIRRKHAQEQVQDHEVHRAVEAEKVNGGREGACIGVSAGDVGTDGREGSTVLEGVRGSGWGVADGVEAAAADRGFIPRAMLGLIVLVAVLLVLWSTRTVERAALSH